MKTATLLATCAFALVATSGLVWAAAPTDIVIDDTAVFPESMGATPDGAFYIGSVTKARIYRALPGHDRAEPWIEKEAGDLHRVLGVLPDAKSGLLYVCDDGDKPALKTFALKTGKPLKTYAFPDGGLCNDIAVHNGDAYASDTTNGRILKLAKGADAFTVWYSNKSDPSIDGLVWARDGKVYFNTFGTGHLVRLDVNADGSAGAATVLATSTPLHSPDGMRLSTDGRILMIEGQGVSGPTDGRVDLVTPHDDSATITVLKAGFEQPTAVTPVGNTAWVLESKFNHQRGELAGKNPGDFHVYAVPLSK